MKFIRNISNGNVSNVEVFSMFDAFFDIYVRKSNIASDEFSENCTNSVKMLEN